MKMRLFTNQCILRGKWLCFLSVLLPLVPIGNYAETAKDFDIVTMKTGNTIEGCLLVETDSVVTIESSGGSVTVPTADIEKIQRSRPGESQLMLGLQLLEKRKLDRADRLLKKASIYPDWRASCKEALNRLEEYKAEFSEEQKQKEQKDIENLIRNRGLQAGITALERRHKNTKEPKSDKDEDFWGNMRGNLHLMMARDRIDHLDLRKAEQHLQLAEEYGVDSTQWEAVRKELLDARRESVLLGPNALASKKFEEKRKKKPVLKGSTPFLVAVRQAEARGEKIPPMSWLQVIDQCAEANQVDPLLVWALIDTESAWREDAISSKGAQGLMQLMPKTAKELEVSDPFNAEENIRGGISYMRYLIEMFNDTDTALAAYNVGLGTVGRNGIPPAGKRYIEKIRKRFARLQERFGTMVASS